MNYPFRSVLSLDRIARFLTENPEDEAVQMYLASEPQRTSKRGISEQSVNESQEEKSPRNDTDEIRAADAKKTRIDS